MTYREWTTRLNEIIDRLNELEEEHDNLEGVGALSLEMALEDIADADEGTYPYHNPPTEEELVALKAECERNDDRVCRINDEIQMLLTEYNDLTGVSPHLYSSGRWGRSVGEQVSEEVG